MSKRLSASIALALCSAGLLLGCGGGGGGGGDSPPASEPSPQPVSPVSPSAPAGPLTDAEIESVATPTLEQFIAAYERVTGADLSIVDDEQRLARAVFDEVRRAGTSAATPDARAQAVDASARSLLDKAMKLTLQEWKAILASPRKGYAVSQTVDPARQAAVDKMACDVDVGFADGKADALRHAYWNALMVRRTTPEYAERFATAHESGSASDAAKQMDLHNNAVGRALAVKQPFATDEQLLEMLLQMTYTYVPAGLAIAAGPDVLVYISERAKRDFDGKYVGSLTNPDSGGPWSATINIAQCGSVVRGNIRLLRGSTVQERRFNATLQPSAPMVVSVSDPYVFENPSGLLYCADMQAVLTGTSQALSGSWTSSTCRLGGVVSVTKQP